jgi:hypothetical protein
MQSNKPKLQNMQPTILRGLFLLAGICVFVVVLAVGCRTKNPTTSNNDPTPGTTWTITGSTFSPAPLPRHRNDTLTVRVYCDSLTHHVANMHIRAKALHGTTTADAVTTIDTVGHPWGTTYPIIYITQNDTVVADIVDYWLVRDDGHDTLKHCQVVFKLL